jgi:hypothetical protein
MGLLEVHTQTGNRNLSENEHVERIKRITLQLEQLLSCMDHQLKSHQVTYQVLGVNYLFKKPLLMHGLYHISP